MDRVEFIFTIGYEGASLVSLVQSLQRNAVALVLDVRRDAWSRRTCFRKGELEKALSAEGIAYRHEPRLGVPKEKRDEFRGRADGVDFGTWYRMEVLENRRELLDELGKLVESAPTALLCYEADPAHCHRYLLAGELARLTDLDVRHLTP